jgi:hypothetical protein
MKRISTETLKEDDYTYIDDYEKFIERVRRYDKGKYSSTIFWIPTFVGMTSFRRKPESIITKNI